MVQPVQPSDPSSHISSAQTPQEKQKLFELQFEIALLSAYVAITGQDGSIKHQISQLKNGLASKLSPNQLSTNINQLLSDINNNIVPGKALFPPFAFTSESSQTQAISNFALSLEKFLNTAAEKGSMGWKEEQRVFEDLSMLMNNVGQMTPERAFSKLNSIIEAANAGLPDPYKLPTIPFALR